MKSQENISNNKTDLAGAKHQLQVEDELLRFQVYKNNELLQEITLKAGHKFIGESFFKQEIPTDAETDHAINYIEDQLMSNRALFQNRERLYTSDKELIALFKKNGLDRDSYSRQSVEDLFSRYARVIMGAPASVLEATITRNDFAHLLILREIMHHLDYVEIILDN